MQVTTEHSASSSRPRRNRRRSSTEPTTQAETASPTGDHDPSLLLAALEEIEQKQRAIASILESGLLGHCLE